MAIWLAVVLVLIAFNVGFILGAWWRGVFSDMPLVQVSPIPADDIYGRIAEKLMRGEI